MKPSRAVNLDRVELINAELLALPNAFHSMIEVKRTWREKHPNANAALWCLIGALAMLTFLSLT